MSTLILASLVCLSIVTVGQGMASCEGHLDGCSTVGDSGSTTSQSLLQRKRNMLNKVRGVENDADGTSQAGGVMDDPPSGAGAPSESAGATGTSSLDAAVTHAPSERVADVTAATNAPSDTGISNNDDHKTNEESDEKEDEGDEEEQRMLPSEKAGAKSTRPLDVTAATDAPPEPVGTADTGISNNGDYKTNEESDEKEDEEDEEEQDDGKDGDEVDDDNDDEGTDSPARQFRKDVKKDAKTFVKAMKESMKKEAWDEDSGGHKDGHEGGSDSATENKKNFLCIDEGKFFANAKAANKYFMKECLDVYEYNATLCDGLSDKIFEQNREDMSVEWTPDQDVCDEIDALLRADTARRHEMGLTIVVASEPTESPLAMLERAKRSSSASGSSTLDEVMRFKPIAPAPSPHR